MYKQEKNEDSNNAAGKVVAAFVAGAATAIIAGGYALYGPGGKERRKNVGRWLEDAREEIVDRMSDAKDMTQATYNRIVDEVLDSYSDVKDLSQAQVRLAATKLKARYREMRQLARKAADDARREADDLDE
jgi:hypothetical protein